VGRRKEELAFRRGQQGGSKGSLSADGGEKALKQSKRSEGRMWPYGKNGGEMTNRLVRIEKAKLQPRKNATRLSLHGRRTGSGTG